MVTCRRIFISSITHTMFRQKLFLSLSLFLFLPANFPKGVSCPPYASLVVHPSFTILVNEETDYYVRGNRFLFFCFLSVVTIVEQFFDEMRLFFSFCFRIIARGSAIIYNMSRINAEPGMYVFRESF